ncbi:MAG: hypothetical protein JWL97_3974, partial [Gemmatimonadales bacterium]|nr:hypothetical protein [Gemmatimonadales bacterium]
RSEAGDRSNATLTHQELEDFTWQVLHKAGFKPSGADADLHSKIVTAATRRLVLIAPRGDDGYGFDVRSLQELMAAMHLTAGPLHVVTERLRTAASSPHWRNTWIFAAGRVFSIPQDHEHQALVELVESIDDGAYARLGNVVPIGPRLALDLIDDGMARSLPKWRDRLIARGLRVLQEPMLRDLLSNTGVILLRFADTGDQQRQTVAEGLRDALGGSQSARVTAHRFQAMVGDIAEMIHSRPETQWLAEVLKRPGESTPPAPPDGWADFDDEIATSPLSEDALGKVTDAVTAIRRISQQPRPPRRSRSAARVAADEKDMDAILAALADDQGAQALAAALHHVMAHEPILVEVLRDDILPIAHRAAVGELLR